MMPKDQICYLVLQGTNDRILTMNGTEPLIVHQKFAASVAKALNEKNLMKDPASHLVEPITVQEYENLYSM